MRSPRPVMWSLFVARATSLIDPMVVFDVTCGFSWRRIEKTASIGEQRNSRIQWPCRRGMTDGIMVVGKPVRAAVGFDRTSWPIILEKVAKFTFSCGGT